MPDGDERNAKSTEVLRKMNQVTMDIIVETIEYISSPNGIVLDKNFIKEFLENVDVKTFEKIKDISLELKKSTDTKPLKFKCINCSHEYEQPFNVNVSDFFG
jgi:MoaA/NifB/PqqE/SkfB family radical SAM enzyme